MRSSHHLEPVYHPASSLSPPSIIQALETLHGFQKAFPQLLAIAPAVSSHEYCPPPPLTYPIIQQASLRTRFQTQPHKVSCFLLDPVEKSVVTGTKLNSNHLFVHLSCPPFTVSPSRAGTMSFSSLCSHHHQHWGLHPERISDSTLYH